MEADFTRFYGQDLRALCWGDSRWGARRILTHIRMLPRDSAYVRHLSGEFAYWDEHAELLASLVDAVQQNTYTLLRLHGAEAQPPAAVLRPGQASPVPEIVSLADFAASLKG